MTRTTYRPARKPAFPTLLVAAVVGLAPIAASAQTLECDLRVGGRAVDSGTVALDGSSDGRLQLVRGRFLAEIRAGGSAVELSVSKDQPSSGSSEDAFERVHGPFTAGQALGPVSVTNALVVCRVQS